jgi:hypothetical protein
MPPDLPSICPIRLDRFDVNSEGATGAPERKGNAVKYMILTFASQQDYQEMAGQPTERPAWSQEDYVAVPEPPNCSSSGLDLSSSDTARPM